MVWIILASIGLTFLLKYGTVLRFFRNFLTSRSKHLTELFACSLCLGFWSGVLLTPIAIIKLGVVYGLLTPLVSAACSWCIDTILQCFQYVLSIFKRLDP